MRRTVLAPAVAPKDFFELSRLRRSVRNKYKNEGSPMVKAFAAFPLRRLFVAGALAGLLAPLSPSFAQMMGVPQLPQIPAFLPSLESVAPTPPQPLDGTG